MKKLFAVMALVGMLSFGTSTILMAQEEDTNEAQSTEVQVDSVATDSVISDPNAATGNTPTIMEEDKIESTNIHAAIKQKFIEGGAGFMSAVALCLILGLALSIERVIYLNLSDISTDKSIEKMESILNENGVEAAKEFCKTQRGPVASIYFQALTRYDQGVDVVEKTVSSYGSVQVGLLEKGLSWIGLFISLAPMLGFLGTVIGMIGAFDDIQSAGDMSPAVVAGGIKVALITTVGGLIVAMILQIFFNYCVAKIEGIVNKMEDASVTLMDIIVKYNETNKK